MTNLKAKPNVGSRKSRDWKYSGDGHPAAARWDEEWDGLTWQDMPGSQTDTQKMNFFLWRRGILRQVEEA